MSYVIYSDGGGTKLSAAAGACIIEDKLNNNRVNLVAYLGVATNNEAEIFAGLLGFCFLYALNDKTSDELVWVSDSEYALKSATEYIKNWQTNNWKTASRTTVKNLALWKTFLRYSEGIFNYTETRLWTHRT